MCDIGVYQEGKRKEEKDGEEKGEEVGLESGAVGEHW